MDKLERLLNLIALLRATRRPIAASEIREKLRSAYGEGEEAFHRMFERDKAEIRELGYTLEQEETLSGEPGYRIARGETLSLSLEPDEMAALSLAAQAWGGRADGPVGVLKLGIGSGSVDAGSSSWILPRVRLDRTVETLMDAITRRKIVRFAYRRGGGADPEEREVEPHGLVHRGDWYLAGFDRARGAVRRFKLSRVEGGFEVAGGRAPDFDPPADADLHVMRGPWEADEGAAQAVVAFSPEAAWWVERRTGADRIEQRGDGWVVFRLPIADVHGFAGWVAGFADDAVVVEPADVRDAVVAHVRAAVED